MKNELQEIDFRQQDLDLISKVNMVIREYKEKGYELTLRQLYYQLVAREILPNTECNYKNIGNLISDGRMAGLIDWDAFIDRTRNLKKNNHWESPADIVLSCVEQFQFDKWEGQEHYVEVWVENDALISVVERVCKKLDVPIFSCRGYNSQSEMWNAAERLLEYEGYRQQVIIYLGDHYASGKDMSRDIVDRLRLIGVEPIFEKIALNMSQIEQYNPPSNPTKLTDSGVNGYIYGEECWQLEALRPEVIDSLITTKVYKYLDLAKFNKMKKEEQIARKILELVYYNWDTFV